MPAELALGHSAVPVETLVQTLSLNFLFHHLIFTKGVASSFGEENKGTNLAPSARSLSCTQDMEDRFPPPKSLELRVLLRQPFLPEPDPPSSPSEPTFFPELADNPCCNLFSKDKSNLFFVCFVLVFCLFRAHPWHMEVPRRGAENRSCSCMPTPQPQPRWILNPLSKASWMLVRFVSAEPRWELLQQSIKTGLCHFLT